MKRVHPNLIRAAALIATAAALTVAGCQNQQIGIAANPFMAPSRVPPPSTRALLPGQAQPYYPGDPLPVMQSNAAEPAAAPAVAPPAEVQLASATEPEMPSATEHLSWTSPRGQTNSPTPALSTPTLRAPAPSSPQLVHPAPSSVATNEPIAIPDDGNSLRFALPESSVAAVEPRPFVPSGLVGLATSQAPPQPIVQSPAMQPMPQLPSPPSAAYAPRPAIDGVAQASYTEPVIPVTAVETSNPWRSPQIPNAFQPPELAPGYSYPPTLAAQSTVAPVTTAALPAMPPTMAPPPVVANTVDVRLRAVPSPPELYAPSMPRIRIPGYESSPPMLTSNDGFRPRTSMR
jgi:hypothetical protein